MNSNLELLLEEHQSNKVIKRLIDILVPGGGTINDVLSSYLLKEKERRLKVFYEALANEEIKLTDEVIASDEFLNKYFITLKAVTETRRNEKIVYFAKLLNNSNSDSISHASNQYDDFVKVLDDLTYQELFVLKQISEHEIKHHIQNARKIMIGRRFYKILKTKVAMELGISEDEALSIFTRLERTGCVNHTKATPLMQDSNDAIVTTDFYLKLESLALQP